MSEKSEKPEKSESNAPPVLSDQEIDELIEKFKAVEKSPIISSERLYKFIKRYFSPTAVGLENIPKGPTLFVGNHSFLGFDGIIVNLVMWHEAGRFPRAMADLVWMKMPNARDKFIESGMILGHPKVCATMMSEGVDLLVYPGGAHESMKAADEFYELQWRERYGFVRMAAENGYNITPFGVVGPEESYDRWMEKDEVRDSWLGKFLSDKGVRPDMIPPIPRGVFSTLLPKPQHTYIAFGKPIDVPDYSGGKTVPKKVLREVRAEVAAGVEGLLRDMLLLRAQQRGSDSQLRRWLTR